MTRYAHLACKYSPPMALQTDVILEGWRKSQRTSEKAHYKLNCHPKLKPQALSQYTRWRATEVWFLHLHTQVCVHTHMNIYRCVCVCLYTKVNYSLPKPMEYSKSSCMRNIQSIKQGHLERSKVSNDLQLHRRD